MLQERLILMQQKPVRSQKVSIFYNIFHEVKGLKKKKSLKREEKKELWNFFLFLLLLFLQLNPTIF